MHIFVNLKIDWNEMKSALTKYIRLVVYSYLSDAMVLHFISRLSKAERNALKNSALASNDQREAKIYLN